MADDEQTDEEIAERRRKEFEAGAVEVTLVVYPRRLGTDRAARNALIAAQADALIEFAADLAGQAGGE